MTDQSALILRLILDFSWRTTALLVFSCRTSWLPDSLNLLKTLTIIVLPFIKMATVSITRYVVGQISYIPRTRGGGLREERCSPLDGGGGLGIYPEKMLESWALLCVLMLFHAFDTIFRSFFLEILSIDAWDTEHSRFRRFLANYF